MKNEDRSKQFDQDAGCYPPLMPETDAAQRAWAHCNSHADDANTVKGMLLTIEQLERDLADANEQLAEAKEDVLAYAQLLTAKDRELAAEQAKVKRLTEQLDAIMNWGGE